jgi:hypothetical protein
MLHVSTGMPVFLISASRGFPEQVALTCQPRAWSATIMPSATRSPPPSSFDETAK